MNENFQDAKQGKTSTSLKENKALYQHFIQLAFNEGQLDLLDELLSPSYQYLEVPPGTSTGKEAIKQVVTTFREAFPDSHISFEYQATEGDKVCSHTITRGSHRGTLLGVEPTGRTVTMPGLKLVRIEDGKVVESRVKNDVMSLVVQLGAKT